MYEDIFEMFQSWREPKFCILGLYQEKKVLDLNNICSGGMRAEGMLLLFWKVDLAKHANVQPRLVNTDVLYATTLREAPAKKNHVYLGTAQIAIWPPLLRKSGHFVAQIFCRKLENSLNSNFDFGNEYFDSD